MGGNGGRSCLLGSHQKSFQATLGEDLVLELLPQDHPVSQVENGVAVDREGAVPAVVQGAAFVPVGVGPDGDRVEEPQVVPVD